MTVGKIFEFASKPEQQRQSSSFCLEVISHLATHLSSYLLSHLSSLISFLISSLFSSFVSLIIQIQIQIQIGLFDTDMISDRAHTNGNTKTTILQQYHEKLNTRFPIPHPTIIQEVVRKESRAWSRPLEGGQS